MATPPTANPITAATPNRLVFDAGAVYKSWDSSPVLLGTTRGGAVFEIARETREVEMDGKRGLVKGLKRTLSMGAKLTVSFVELSDALFKELLYQVSKTAPNANLHTWRPDLLIDAADYAANIALVANVSGSVATPCVLELDNALATGGWSITTKDKDEGVLGPVAFEAHYDPAAATTVPFKIHWPTGAS